MKLVWDIKHSPYKQHIPEKSPAAEERFYKNINHWKQLGYCGWSMERALSARKTYYPDIIIRPCEIMLISEKRSTKYKYLLVFFGRVHNTNQRFAYPPRPLMLFELEDNDVLRIGRFKEYFSPDKLEKLEEVGYFRGKDMSKYTFRTVHLKYYMYDYDFENKQLYLYLISRVQNQALRIFVNDTNQKCIDKIFEYFYLIETNRNDYDVDVNYGAYEKGFAQYLLYNIDIHKYRYKKYDFMKSLKKIPESEGD